MQHQKPLGIGIVGLGMVARAHAQALLELDCVSVRGVYAPSRAGRSAFSQDFGFPAVDSFEALLELDSLEALLVLTPPNARLEIAEAAARAKLHLLMEKPLERGTTAALRIVETAEQAGIALGVVFQNRMRPAARALKAFVEGGELGEIAVVRINVPWWRTQNYYDEPGRGTLERDGGGVLISQAIHTLDLAQWIAGPVAEVQAIAATTRLHRMEGEDFVGAGLIFENGAPGVLAATTAAFPGSAAEISIDFDRGSARLEGGMLSVARRDREALEAVGENSGTGAGADPMAFPHEWHRALIADFAEAVRLGRPPACSGREALTVHRLIDALMLSSRLRRAVRPADLT